MQIPDPKLIPSLFQAKAVAGELAAAAKLVFDGWEQDVDGFDEELGEGGICHEIADAMIDVLSKHGVNDAISFQASVGENHVYVVALLEDGVYTIDIPPSVYEIGSGYVWKKRADAIFATDVVTFDRIADPVSPDVFGDLYSGY